MFSNGDRRRHGTDDQELEPILTFTWQHLTQARAAPIAGHGDYRMPMVTGDRDGPRAERPPTTT